MIIRKALKIEERQKMKEEMKHAGITGNMKP